MKNRAIAVFAAGVLLTAAGCSQVNGQGTGPGYGPGYGPGMMGGYGPGYGPGPGMMGGYGPGYGPGPMMGGYGPGMMGGYGPGMMGGGYGYGRLPDLTPDQRSRIATIQRDFRARQWPLMQQMHELMWGDGTATDEQAQRRDYDKLAALQKQMFENMLESRKRMDEVLTPQQRDEMRRGWRAPR